LHGRQDLPDLKPLYLGFSDMPLVSISNAQRKPIPNANFVATVYHDLPLHLLKPTCRASGGYVAFLGRISPEKRPDRAIRIAQALGLPMACQERLPGQCGSALTRSTGRSRSDCQ
jgi:glycosyltransferase involved in cell wall biosynthesis